MATKLKEVLKIENTITGRVVKAPYITQQHISAYTNSVADGTWKVKKTKSIRRSDIWFFGTIILSLFSGIIISYVDFEIFTKYNPTLVMILTLFPYVIIKMFFRNSKLFKWLNAKVL